MSLLAVEHEYVKQVNLGVADYYAENKVQERVVDPLCLPLKRIPNDKTAGFPWISV